VARGLPCALTIAGADAALCERVVAAVHGNNIRIYSSDDLVGVEIGGAVKNILAIATGVADGLQLGLNARAALITRGLAEITRLGVALGGRAETFMGLSGVGDLILTCTGDLSRNRRVGLGLAQNKKLDVIVAELGHVAEGVRCAQAVRALAREKGIEMPITDAVAAALFDGVSVQKWWPGCWHGIRAKKACKTVAPARILGREIHQTSPEREAGENDSRSRNASGCFYRTGMGRIRARCRPGSVPPQRAMMSLSILGRLKRCGEPPSRASSICLEILS
jgi:hypothetical protein